MVDYFNVNTALQHQYNTTTRQWQPETVQSSLTSLLPTSSYDTAVMTYTAGNLTSVVYKSGGVSGTTIATLTLSYDGSGNLTSAVRT